MPQTILYDNTKLAVAQILPDGTRRKTRAFSELQSHYLFAERFRLCAVQLPGAGSTLLELAGVECATPRAMREAGRAAPRGHEQTIGERFQNDAEALLPLPPVPYEACEKRTTRVTLLSLVRYRSNDYSVPTAYGHRDVLIKGYVHEVVICSGSEVIARHARSYEREDMI